VLALSNRLVVIIPLTATATFEDHGFFVVPIGRNKYRHRPANGFLGRIAKEPLSTLVPTGDDAVEVLGMDRVVRRLYDRRVVLSGAIARQAFDASAPGTERSSINL
jgi:hypothetical protein